MAGLTHIPAFIRRDLSDVDVLELQWQENAQREDVDDIDKAMHLRRMKEARSLSWSQMVDTVHLSRRHLLRMQQLAEMPEDVIAKVRTRELTPSHVYQLARIADGAERSRLADAAALGRWSVMALSRQIDEVIGTGADAAEAAEADGTEDASMKGVGDEGVAGVRPQAADPSLSGGPRDATSWSDGGGGGAAEGAPPSPDAPDGLTAAEAPPVARIDLSGVPPAAAVEALARALTSAWESAVSAAPLLSTEDRSALTALAAEIARDARTAQSRLKTTHSPR